jgi:hypothetical protein
VAELNAAHAPLAITQTVSVLPEKHSVVVKYSAQLPFTSTHAVYAALTEQILPPVLIPLQYDAVSLVPPVTVLQLLAAKGVPL